MCERLAKHASRIFVALFEMMPSEFIHLVLIEIGVLMFVVDLLNLLIHFISYLMGTCLLSLYGLVVRTHSCFCKSCHNG
jgi:hypothetical protein